MHDHSLKEEPILVRNLSRGSLLAFNTLYHHYSKHLYGFAFAYLKSEEEAEELVQEVFTIIWEKRSTLREELSFRSFIFTIAFNIIRKHFRKRLSLLNYLKSGINSDLDMQTSQKITHDSLFQFISRLVNLLPQRRKEIFIKSRFEGLTIKEISEDLNISHKTVENQLTDALKFIRTNIRSEYIPFILFIIIFSK
jgi:RNA polymerase sigma-70 factor (ECF subfamily)